MKILRTRENGRPHSRAKEKLRSLTLRYLFLCLSRSLSLAASSSLSPPAFCLRVSRPLSFAALRHRQLRSCTPTELHGRHGWAQGLIPPPLSVRRGAGGGGVHRASIKGLQPDFPGRNSFSRRQLASTPAAFFFFFFFFIFIFFATLSSSERFETILQRPISPRFVVRRSSRNADARSLKTLSLSSLVSRCPLRRS